MRTIVVALLAGLAAAGPVAGGPPQSLATQKLGRHFGAFTGCLVLHDIGRNHVLRINDAQCSTRLPPGATFHPYLALVALETGVGRGAAVTAAGDDAPPAEAEDSEKIDVPAALRSGARAPFQDIARQIGAERLGWWLDTAPFGNRDMSGGLTEFWSDSTLALTANEQDYFWTQLYASALPFRPEVAEAVRQALTISATDDTEFAGASATGAQERLGWFVGHARSINGEFVIVVNIEGDHGATGAKAQEIAVAILKDRRILR